jgi:hypothetical protein
VLASAVPAVHCRLACSINKYSSCSPECFVLALVFIDRLIQRNALLLSSLNVHRVIITAVMLAGMYPHCIEVGPLI